MEDMIFRAKEKAEAGQLIEARNLLAKVVLQDPNNVEAWFLLGQVADTKLFRCFCFYQVLQLDPDHQQGKNYLNKHKSWETNTASSVSEIEIGSDRLFDDAAIAIWREILDAAQTYRFGGYEDNSSDNSGNEWLNEPETRLKCAAIYHRLGDMYFSGGGVKKDANQALKYYKECAHLGDDNCWGDMAICAYIIEDFKCADESWINFFEKVSIEEIQNLPLYYSLCFCQYMRTVNSQPHDPKLEWFYRKISKEY